MMERWYPRIYRCKGLVKQLVAEASDGKIYSFPNGDGGWHERTLYRRTWDELQLLDMQEAQRIIQYVNGLAHSGSGAWIIEEVDIAEGFYENGRIYRNPQPSIDISELFRKPEPSPSSKQAAIVRRLEQLSENGHPGDDTALHSTLLRLIGGSGAERYVASLLASARSTWDKNRFVEWDVYWAVHDYLTDYYPGVGYLDDPYRDPVFRSISYEVLRLICQTGLDLDRFEADDNGPA
jgi:hypothetical protein